VVDFVAFPILRQLLAVHMNGSMFDVRLGWLVIAIGLGAGCSEATKLNPVEGKVLFQGQPLAGALVSFHPGDIKDNPPTGYTKEDGTFKIVTGDLEGAKAGTYKVTIMCQVPVKTKAEGMSFGGLDETDDKLKGAYANRDASKITVTVKEGANQLEPFDLK
jgi:hypothetical protein